jgi:hypothetical protein
MKKSYVPFNQSHSFTAVDQQDSPILNIQRPTLPNARAQRQTRRHIRFRRNLRRPAVVDLRSIR